MRNRWIKNFAAAAAIAMTASFSRPPKAANAEIADESVTARSVITRLVSRHQTITITATGNGPRYSVADAAGKTLLADATLDELRVKEPLSYHQVQAAIAHADPAPSTWAGE